MTAPWLCPCRDSSCPGKTLPLHPRIQQLIDDLTIDGAVITSGLRCPAHNAAVGGEPGSKHQLGEALDFVPQDRLIAVQGLLDDGKWRIITYATDNHVHVHVADEARLYVKYGSQYVRAL